MGTARLFFGWSGKNQNRKNTAFQPEPHGKFPVEPGKTGTGKNEDFGVEPEKTARF